MLEVTTLYISHSIKSYTYETSRTKQHDWRPQHDQHKNCNIIYIIYYIIYILYI
jgi:hypothetical protein